MVPAGADRVIELVSAAAELQSFCEERAWPFCFIGGLALQHWGEQRLTRNVDATVLTGFGSESSFVDALLARFPARGAGARAFALDNRVLLLTSGGGGPLDIALGALPFEVEAVARARNVAFTPDVRLRICTAEDLVVMKAFADRPRDWVDIEGILVRQKGRLDWGYIERHLGPLAEAKEAPGILPRLAGLRAAFDAGEGPASAGCLSGKPSGQLFDHLTTPHSRSPPKPLLFLSMPLAPVPISNRRIRFALVGCGRISGKHVEALEAHKDSAELVAVCDADAGAAARASDLYCSGEGRPEGQISMPKYGRSGVDFRRRTPFA